MIAATPPFATKDPAGDEGVDEAAAAADVRVAAVVTGPPAPAAEVNGTGMGIALGPVGVRPAAEHSTDCNMTAATRSAVPQFAAIQPPASAWN